MNTLRPVRDDVDAPIAVTDLLDDLQQSLRGLGVSGLGVVLLVLALRLHATHADRTAIGQAAGRVVDATVEGPAVADALAPAAGDAADGVQVLLEVAMNVGLGCFVMPALLLFIGWELWEGRLGLEARERACAHRRRGGLPGRVARRGVCALVSATKWITIAVSILLLVAAVLLVLTCVASLAVSSMR